MGYSAGPTGELLWWDGWRDPQRDTRRDPLAGCSVAVLWRAGYLAGSSRSGTLTDGLLWWDTGEQLWRETGQMTENPLASALAGYLTDPLVGCSGRILGGIHSPAALAGDWAGSTGAQLWRDTRRDLLASCSGEILGGIRWRAALAGHWAGAWCRRIANANSKIKSNIPFLSGGELNATTNTQRFELFAVLLELFLFSRNCAVLA